MDPNEWERMSLEQVIETSYEVGDSEGARVFEEMLDDLPEEEYEPEEWELY